MADVKVFYNEDCQQCPPYLDNLQRCSEKFSHTCEVMSLQDNPLDVVQSLQDLRESGHTVSSLPFFIVAEKECKYSYEGILPLDVIDHILKKFIS